MPQNKINTYNLYNQFIRRNLPCTHVHIEEDLDGAGEALAVEILRALQSWHKEAQIGLQLCTGDSPFIGYRRIGGDNLLQARGLYSPEDFIHIMSKYRKIGAILDTWDTTATQKFLKDKGLNPALKPMMNKVVIFAIDALFPQRRTDYFAFANLLNNICDLWGIPDDNRNLFYGDIYVTRYGNRWKVEEIPDDEYKRILESINSEGLKILEYQAACMLRGDNKGFSLNSILRIKKGRVVGRRLQIDNRGDYRMRQLHIEPLRQAHPQYKYLESMRNQALMMHEKLIAFGGAHITLLGVGPSYEGEGHIGFCEKYTPHEQTCFIGAVNDCDATFHICASHAKELGGIKNMFVTFNGVRIPRFGFITYGPMEMIYRQYKYKDRCWSEADNILRRSIVIIIATGNLKSRSIVKALENGYENRYPLSLIRNYRTIYILDQNSARELRVKRYPWEFQILPKEYWSIGNMRKFLIQIAAFSNCRILAIDFNSIADRLKGLYSVMGKDVMMHIHNNCKVNLSNLRLFLRRTKVDFERIKEMVSSEISSGVIRPFQIVEKLRGWGMERGDNILCITPHMDDDFLAMMHILKEMAPHYNIHTCYTSSGFTGVYSDYVLGLLGVAGRLSQREIDRLRPQIKESLLKELIKERIGSAQARHLDYNVLSYMNKREMMIRAKLLLIDLNERYDLEGKIRKIFRNRFINRTDILNLRKFLANVEYRKKQGAEVDIDIMRFLKTSVRFTEAASGLMFLGISYKNIHWPLKMSFYGIPGRGLTIEDDDINLIEDLIKDIAPKMVVFNGEGFPDFSSHSNTEIGVYLALFELFKKGSLSNDLILFQWAGVWDRIGVDASKVSVVLTDEELQSFYNAFNYFYPTQAPYAPVLNASSSGPQSFAQDVIRNARASAKEMVALVDIPLYLLQIIKQKGGILNYRMSKLRAIRRYEFYRKYEMLMRSRFSINISSNAAFCGSAPYAENLNELPLSLISKMSMLGVISKREKAIFGYGNSFQLSSDGLLRVVKAFCDEMRDGLEAKRGCSLAMLPTFVGIPTGKESGIFLALDLGGSTFRVLMVYLSPDKNQRRIIIEKYSLKATETERRKGIDYDCTQLKADELFIILAKYIKMFLIKHHTRITKYGYNKPYPAGFTFSFPVIQTDIDRAILKRCSKGFRLEDLFDKDVVSLFKKIIQQEGLGDIVNVVSLNNDTVGTLLSRRYYDSDCDIGGIVGTGTNFCYIERIENIHSLTEETKKRYGKQKMVINIESGNFNKIRQNIYDRLLDKNSTNRGEQIAEKMISGLYLGELTRLVLIDLIKKKLLFQGKITEEEMSMLLQKDSFPTPFMTEIIADSSDTLRVVRSKLIQWGIRGRHISLEDVEIVKRICAIVSRRAARITAAVIFAIIMHIDKYIERRHAIAMDGSLFEKHPAFRDEMRMAIREISMGIFKEDRSDKISFELTTDGSGLGAAVIAAMATA